MREIRTLPVERDQLFSGEVARQIPYHMMYGKPYCLPALTIYTAEEYEQIAVGSQRVHHLYRKTLQFVQQYLPVSYLVEQLALHPVLAEIACLQVPWDGLTRLDWIISPDGILKCIENNTETPTGIPEAAYLENKLLEYTTGLSPASSRMNDCLRRMFVEAVHYYKQQGLGGPLYMTSYDWHDEDRVNTLYLLEQCTAAGMEARFVPLEQLRIVPGKGLYVKDEPIELLYRLYPLEYLIEDYEEDSGRPVGQDLLQLVADGKLGLINPVQHIISQSKGFMATLWSLYERNDQLTEYAGFRLFTEEECDWIQQYLLPTYFTPAPFIQADLPYVSKSYFGREGQGTRLIEQPQQQDPLLTKDLHERIAAIKMNEPPSDRNTAHHTHSSSSYEDVLIQSQQLEDEATAAYYEYQPKIYQQMHPMEPVCADTSEGHFEGYLLTGAFVIGGQFAGLLPRIGGKVTDNMACYCGAAILEPEPS